MIESIQTHLMFTGSAEAAMDLYVRVLSGEVLQIERYPDSHETLAGKIVQAKFTLGSQRFSCSDSEGIHDFSFTPSMSVFLNVSSEQALNEVHGELSVGGKDLMPPDNYGFSDLFAWFNDQYGVSWQLNYSANVV